MKNHRAGGRGIEMLHILTKKFNPLDMDAVGDMLTELQTLSLADWEDLSILINKVSDISSCLAMVKQNPPKSFMVHHIQNVLKESRYGPNLIVLLRTHAANRTAFHTIDELVVALHRMDKVNGRDYGGQAISTKTPSSDTKVNFAAGTISKGKTTPLSREQFVSSVLTPPVTEPELTYDWMGARDLTDEQIKIICANQQCPVCRTDKHPWNRCSKLLNRFDIIKKDIPPKDKDSAKKEKNEKDKEKGKASSVSTPLILPDISPSENRFQALSSDDESSFDDVIVDVLDEEPSHLAGAASSVAHMLSTFNIQLIKPWSFHMTGFGHEVFMAYQKIIQDQWDHYCENDVCHHLQVIGRGTIKFLLQGNEVILENVLHIPSLSGIYVSLDELHRSEGCFTDDSCADGTTVYFPFPALIRTGSPWIVEGSFAPDVVPNECVSLGIFRWGVDQLHYDIDPADVYHLEIDDSSFKSSGDEFIVDSCLALHGFSVLAVSGNNASSDEVSMYASYFLFNSVHKCAGSASSVETGVFQKDKFDWSSGSGSDLFVIADSGATSHMFPDRNMFISYKTTPGSYVILANKQKVSNPGRADVRLRFGKYTVVLTDVLHVPSLHLLLYSIRVHRRSLGCSFIANNKGIYLSFPSFVLTVDDSKDCLLKCCRASSVDTVSFHERLAGKVSAVSDNTRHRHRRRGIVSKDQTSSSLGGFQLPSSSTEDCQVVGGDSPSSPFSSSPVIVEDASDDESDSPVEYTGPITELFPHDDVPVLHHYPDDSDSESDDSSTTTEAEVTISDLLEELNIPADPTSPSQLSETQIQQIAAACVKSLKENGCITVSLLNWLREQNFLPSSKPTTTTPPDRPSLLSSDKVPSSSAQKCHLTIPQLHRYTGFRKPRDWKEIIELSIETVTLSAEPAIVPFELGDVANIKRSRRNKVPVPRPAKFLSVVHMDIGYGDCKAVGGAKYCIMLVDCATCYTWIYALKSLTHEDITNALRDFRNDAGAMPTRLYTNFDNKLIAGPTADWIKENHCKIVSAPGGRQQQNGLVGKAWQTVTSMARAYITDMQMPRTYWYWGLCQAVHVINYFPCLVNGLSTTPFELVYGVKPDLRTLFRLFSCGYFVHEKDGSHSLDGIAESKTMQGIAIGRSRQADAMMFYNPATRKIYTSSDYKLDEGRSTPSLFNLKYDGGIFVGLYDLGLRACAEPFPEGTPILWPTTLHGKHVKMRGSVILVPLPEDSSSIPATNDVEHPYTIQLIDGSSFHVSPRRMDDIVDFRSPATSSFAIPSWLGVNQKVMLLQDFSATN